MSNAAAAAAEAAPPSKGKKKLIIIIAAAVLLLGGGGGAALMLLKKKPADGEDGDEHAQVEKAAPKAKAAAKHDPKHPPAFVPLDPFTVNLADRETERYAQVAVTLELDEAKTAEQVKVYMPAIRNNILMVLAHKTSTQILASEGKAKLAGEIQRAASRALGVELEEPDAEEEAAADTPKKKKKKKKVEVALPVVAVHFSNFIVQ
ncbi:MAG: flagellar protein FliL [Pseudomonadota bacterium]|jgi:flagellar protein FliL